MRIVTNRGWRGSKSGLDTYSAEKEEGKLYHHKHECWRVVGISRQDPTHQRLGFFQMPLKFLANSTIPDCATIRGTIAAAATTTISAKTTFSFSSHARVFGTIFGAIFCREGVAVEEADTKRCCHMHLCLP